MTKHWRLCAIAILWLVIGCGASPWQFHPRAAGLPGPSAISLQAGRAAFFGDGDYFELVDGGAVRAIRGSRREFMNESHVAGLGNCWRHKIAVYDRGADVACAHPRPGDTALVELYRSDDKGRRFRKEPQQLRVRSLSSNADDGFNFWPGWYEERVPALPVSPPDDSDRSFELVMAAGADGALIVSGACESLSCRWPRVLYRQASGELADATLPPLLDGLAGLVFSRDGRRAYALGVTPSQDRYLVLVSDDRGRTFRARYNRPLEPGKGLKVLWAAVGHDEQVAFTIAYGSEPRILLLSEDGASLSVVKPPHPTVWIAAAGQRAVAVLPGLRQAWEMLNGRDWQPLEIPSGICPVESQCPEALACFDWGCVISSRLTRFGWGH